MYDLGFLIGMPAIGIILTVARRYGASPYPLAVKTIFVIVLIVSGVYWVLPKRNIKMAAQNDQLQS